MSYELKLLTLPITSNISAQTLIAGLKMSSRAPRALEFLLGLIGVFNEYASKDKDTTHLSNSELKELLQKEFPGLIQDNPKPEEVNKVMAALDHNKDGQVDIQEYFITLCSLGICIYEEAKRGQGSKK